MVFQELINRKALLFLVIVLLASSLIAQNLVPNGDFERDRHWFGFRTLGKLSYWKKANKTTPDYFFGEFNFVGKQKPHSGSHYIGITVHPQAGKTRYEYVEYISIKLNTSLKSDRIYCISMYVSRADPEYYATNDLNYTFNKQRLKKGGKGFIETYNYKRFEYADDSILKSKKDWMYVCSSFIAKGNEKYLTIGYFNPNIKLYKIDKGKPTSISTYYYIDDVSLVEIEDSTECDCAYKKEVKETNEFETADSNIRKQTIVLDNVYFELNKAELLPNSQPALQKLLTFLKSDTSISIQIVGHTDNTGDELENIRLSEARAKSIIDYLTLNGVDKARMQYKGLGSSSPIDDNATEIGRQKNRRVELIILRK